MIRQGIQPRRGAHDTGRDTDSVRHEKEDADNLLEPRSTDHVRHVGDRVAPSMVVSKVALDDGAVCVEGLPSQDVDGAGEGAEDV